MEELYALILELSEETGISISTLKSMWFGSDTDCFHSWNSYQSWFSQYRDRELAHLAPGTYAGVDRTRVPVEIVKECFSLFKEQEEAYKEILQAWTQYEAVEDGTSTQQVTQNFRKHCADLTAKLRIAEVQFSIQHFLAVCVESITSNRSLKYTHISDRLKKTFEQVLFCTPEHVVEDLQVAT